MCMNIFSIIDTEIIENVYVDYVSIRYIIYILYNIEYIFTNTYILFTIIEYAYQVCLNKHICIRMSPKSTGLSYNSIKYSFTKGNPFW